MLTQKQLEDIAYYLAGSCNLIYGALPENYSDEEEMQLAQYLDEKEIYNCEFCGWWTHPGEICDCEDSQEDK